MKWKKKIEVKNLQAGDNEMYKSSCPTVPCTTKVAKWIQTKMFSANGEILKLVREWQFKKISYIGLL